MIFLSFLKDFVNATGLSAFIFLSLKYCFTASGLFISIPDALAFFKSVVKVIVCSSSGASFDNSERKPELSSSPVSKFINGTAIPLIMDSPSASSTNRLSGVRELLDKAPITSVDAPNCRAKVIACVRNSAGVFFMAFG